MSSYDVHFQIRHIYFDALDRHSYAELEQLNRNEKGYYYEMRVQDLLLNNQIEFDGNPTNYEEWLRHTKTGYDIKVRDPRNGNWITVECKLTLKELYPSWFKRDWLGKSADIIVTNNPLSLSYRDRKMLTRNGKKLFSTMEFVFYLQKLCRGNKYHLNNNEYSFTYGYRTPLPSSVGICNEQLTIRFTRECTKIKVQILRTLFRSHFWIHLWKKIMQKELCCTRFLVRFGVPYADIH